MENNELSRDFAPDDVIRLNDRIDIFRQLTVDQLTSEVNCALFEGLLNPYYDKFTEFCEQVEASTYRDRILNVSCHIADEHIYFDVEYKKE